MKRLPHETVTVGVFRDEAPTRVIEIANQIGLRAVQLHGVESIERHPVGGRAGRAAPSRPFPAGHRRIDRFAEYGAQLLMIDGASPGSGELFDWRLAEGVVDPRRLIVSGGLRPDNVGAAIAHLRPWGVDVCSGVEASPGVKDPGKLREFVAAAHAAAREAASAADDDEARSSTAAAGDGRRGHARPVRLAERVVAAEIMGDPGPTGRFGEFGGRFVPESLVPACLELEAAFRAAWADPAFRAEFDDILPHYGGRPTPVTECGRLSTELGVRVLLKREDLAHTGSHKLNNVIGQALLARRMGKSRLIAETGAGQHGVATATAAALFGMECVVYMGEVDIQRQELNVFRMELLGAEVRPVSSGSRTLKDAVNEALRDWVASVGDTHYCLGSVMGPHPYPWMVREFQRVIGDEAREQCRVAARRRRPRRGGGLRRRRLQRRRDLRRVRRRHRRRPWWRWRPPAGRR